MMETGLQNLLAFTSAAAGAGLATCFHFSHRQLCALIGFAAGTLFGAAAFHILPMGLARFSILTTGTTLFSGYALFYLISRYVSHVCPACSASHFEEHEKEREENSFLWLLAAALTLHSLLDGLAIVLDNHEAGRLPIFTTVLIHKFPEGFALCALLIKEKLPALRAALLAILLETSTLLGWVLGVFLLRHFPNAAWFNLILIHAGGGFIFLALHALLNEARKHSAVLPLAFFAAGAALIAFIH